MPAARASRQRSMKTEPFCAAALIRRLRTSVIACSPDGDDPNAIAPHGDEGRPHHVADASYDLGPRLVERAGWHLKPIAVAPQPQRADEVDAVVLASLGRPAFGRVSIDVPKGATSLDRLVRADQHSVAEKSVHHLHHGAVAEDKLVTRVEPAILQHEQELGIARRECQRVLFSVPRQEQTCQALVHLGARTHMRVGWYQYVPARLVASKSETYSRPGRMTRRGWPTAASGTSMRASGRSNLLRAGSRSGCAPSDPGAGG